jgi:hypothetical protein
LETLVVGYVVDFLVGNAVSLPSDLHGVVWRALTRKEGGTCRRG